MTSNVQNGEAIPEEAMGDSAFPTAPPAIQVQKLRKSFGKTEVLGDLTMTVPHGAVYALLGRNGAGKSTLIQILLGLLEPNGGEARVMGMRPVQDGAELRQRLGYVPERLPLYDWMTVAQILRFAAAQYRSWSVEVEQALLTRFHIPADRRVRALSRGQHSLLALVLAMAHDPELLLLDECTSGMDAIARTDFDRSVVDSLRRSGRTILFAGHQIGEMERLCDWVGILHEGRMLLEMPVDELNASVKTLRLRAPHELPDTLASLPILDRRRLGRDWLVTVRDYQPSLLKDALPPETQVLEVIDLNLEEIFTAFVKEEAEA